MAAMTERSTSAPGTLSRGLAIIEYVAAHGEVSMQQLADGLDLSRSATYRIVGQLREHGFVTERADGTGVRLGVAAVRVGLQALAQTDLFAIAPPQLRRLVHDTAETAFLAVMDNDEMVYVLQEIGTQAVKMSSKLGSRAPIHCTGLGKAYLSALAEPERREIVSRLELIHYTPTTLTTPQALLAEVERSRLRGFAIDDSEREPDVRCLAAPVVGHDRKPVAALSVGGPAARIRAHETSIAGLVRNAARELSRQLGAPDLQEEAR
ncbi:IclR family transcriptional regulator [Actinopolymorpha pittospori]